ncbi:MAG: 50S ribosomal protein L13 [Bdellovibrionales bacterium]|nr:50S ribosomal protein L13 [Bdellovibrionales bacterium]
MKTWNAKAGEVAQKWLLIDATDKTVGRLASEIAMIIRGKRKASFTPHVDTGDNVIVINSDKVKFTGKKWDVKKYYTHSRYFGSTKETTAREYLEKDSTQVLRFAIEGMLPKNRLGRKLHSKLKIYTGAEHPHSAQKPEAWTI